MRALAPLVFLAAWLTAGPVLARPAAPPASVVAQAKAFQDADPDPEAPERQLIYRPVTISDDGVSDWRVDFSMDPGWCGTGGCRQMIFASRPDGGFEPVFGLQVREFKLTRPKGVARLDVDLHGANCGLTGAEACPRRFTWNAEGFRFEEAANHKGQTRLHGPVAEPLESQAPAIVAAAADALRAECGPDAFAEPGGTPDLNGDGARDWVIATYGCPADSVRVFLSGDGGFTPALQTPGSAYDIDIGFKPARILVITGGECARNQVCAADAYVWEKGALRRQP